MSVILPVKNYRRSGVLLESKTACLRAKPLSSPSRPNHPAPLSGGVAQSASALSPDTVSARHAAPSLWCVARCGVCCPRSALGWSSGEDAGQGGAVLRARGAPIPAWGDARGCARAPPRRVPTGAWGCAPGSSANTLAHGLRYRGRPSLASTSAPSHTPGRPTPWRLCASRAGAPPSPEGAQRAPRRAAGLSCHQTPAVPPRGRPAQRDTWPRRAGPRHNAPCETTIPGGATPAPPRAAYSARPTRARAGPGCGPRAHRPAPPREARPPSAPARLCATPAFTAVACHRCNGRPSCPDLAAQRPAARPRDKTGGGPSRARHTLRRRTQRPASR